MIGGRAGFRAVAAAWADVVPHRRRPTCPRRRLPGQHRAAVAEAGRDPGDVAVLLDVEALLGADLEPLPPSSVLVTGNAAALVDLMQEAVPGAPPTGSRSCRSRCPAGCS